MAMSMLDVIVVDDMATAQRCEELLWQLNLDPEGYLSLKKFSPAGGAAYLFGSFSARPLLSAAVSL